MFEGNPCNIPADLAASVNIDAPVFRHDDVNYLMIGADKRHPGVTTTPMTFGATSTEGALEISSRVIEPIEIGGLVVSELVVDTDLVMGIAVTVEKNGTSSVSMETLNGKESLSFGDHSLRLVGSFDEHIANVFRATVQKLFVPRETPEPPPFSDAFKEYLRENITPEHVLELKERTRPVFYRYSPETRKIRRI